MVGEGIRENLREGILHIGPGHFLVPVMLAEGQLGGEPVVIGIFVVDDNYAFPITIVGHTKQSLERILFLFFFSPLSNFKKTNFTPSTLAYSTIHSQSTYNPKQCYEGGVYIQFMPCIPPKKIGPILFKEQVQTNSDIPSVTLSISVINRKRRARVPDSYAWLAAVAAHIWIIASRCGRGSVRGVVRVWGGRGALVCPVGDTFSIEGIGMLVRLDNEKKTCREQGVME